MAKIIEQNAEKKASSPARQQLKNANAAVAKAQQDVDHAAGLVARAQAALEASRKRLESFHDLDARIVRARVENLKNDKASDAIPGELRDQQRERISAQEDCQHAEHTLAVLDGELLQQKSGLEAAQREQSAAAVAVLGEQIDALEGQYEQAFQTMHRYKILLQGVPMPTMISPEWSRLPMVQRTQQLHPMVKEAGIPFGSPEDVIQLQARITRILQSPQKVDKVDGQRAQARQFWSEFSAAILADPNAEVEQPSLI